MTRSTLSAISVISKALKTLVVHVSLNLTRKEETQAHLFAQFGALLYTTSRSKTSCTCCLSSKTSSGLTYGNMNQLTKISTVTRKALWNPFGIFQMYMHMYKSIAVIVSFFETCVYAYCSAWEIPHRIMSLFCIFCSFELPAIARRQWIYAGHLLFALFIILVRVAAYGLSCTCIRLHVHHVLEKLCKMVSVIHVTS